MNIIIYSFLLIVIGFLVYFLNLTVSDLIKWRTKYVTDKHGHKCKDAIKEKEPIRKEYVDLETKKIEYYCSCGYFSGSIIENKEVDKEIRKEKSK